MNSRLIRISVYLFIIVALALFFTSGYFKDFYQDFKSNSITGYAVSENNQESIKIENPNGIIEISIKELDKSPEVYLNKKIKIIEIIKSSDNKYLYIADEEGNEFKIKNNIKLNENSKYEVIGNITSVSNLYYRYYVVDYYIEADFYNLLS